MTKAAAIIFYSVRLLHYVDLCKEWCVLRSRVYQKIDFKFSNFFQHVNNFESGVFGVKVHCELWATSIHHYIWTFTLFETYNNGGLDS